MAIERVTSGAPWEKAVGYCRAIRVDRHIFVSGTTPVAKDGSITTPNDGYGQAKRCIQIAQEALARFNCQLSAVVRTRMFVTDISRWAEYGRAHQEFFGEHPPVTSMLEVKSLIDKKMLIEIEFDAVLSDENLR